MGDYHKKESEENVIPHIDNHDKVTMMKKKSGGDGEFKYYGGENNVARASMPHIVGDNSDSVEWLKEQMMITMDLNNDGEEYTGSVNGSSSNYLSIRNVVVIAMTLVATTLLL